MLIIVPDQEAKYGNLCDFFNMKVYSVVSLESPYLGDSYEHTHNIPFSI